MTLTGGQAFAAREDCLGEDEALRYVSSSAAAPDQALQRHLDSCAPCRMMIAEATRAMLESSVASSRTVEISAAGRDQGRPGSPTSLAVGEVLLGRYTIVAFVARGGMGEVYEAYDDVLQETVALKTLVCTELDRPAAVHRLMAEVRLARQVTHPNVCRIYEFGLHVPLGRRGGNADPVPFLTMEFLRGETLDRRLARLGRFQPAEVLRLIPHMTAGLGAIHAAGIIHRDIKPANMSLLPGPPERLVLMDLGLARSADPVEASLSLSGGRLVGTIDYMAPEQVRGLPATSRIDVYALGLVIFEMLTGRRPFPRKDALSSAVDRMLRPTPRPTELVDGLDPAWDTFMARCLAPDPDRRFASVEELVDHVETTLTNRRWPRRGWTAALSSRPRLALLAVVAVLVVVLAAVIGALAVKPGRRGETQLAKAAGAAGGPLSAARWAAGPKDARRTAEYRPKRSFAANGCSEDMVRVADQFCIDRFEATIVEDTGQRPLSPSYPPSPDLVTKALADWARRVEGGTTGLPVPLPELPAWQREPGWRPRAVSQAGVTPHGYATQIIAAVACSGAGKRLCSTDEWRLACRGERGTRFPYGDSYRQGVCNVDRDEHPAEMLKIDYTDGLLDPRMSQLPSEAGGPLLRPTGASAGCASRWGNDAVYDMVGNLDEWSADHNGVLLGGFYSRRTQEGCDHTNSKHGPDFFNYSLGIRCCDYLR
jgi:tRNA A-37 threonylcarbamoyl transferase component Bud32